MGKAGVGLVLTLPLVSVPLVLEYEMALKRPDDVKSEDVERVVDYLCEVGERREIYFWWRPILNDPKDEMVLEVAVGGQADAIVTHNLRDFHGVEEKFGIRIVNPATFLLLLEGKSKMSTMSIRLPESLHERARELANREGISINQLIATALAEKISALDTLECLEARGARSSKMAFREALSRIPDRAPMAGDELPHELSKVKGKKGKK